MATFINLTDERYTKSLTPHSPGSTLLFNLAGINNLSKEVSGAVKIKLINHKGKTFAEQDLPVSLPSYLRTNIPVSINLPADAGGYVLVAEFTPVNGEKVISRRFLKIGQLASYQYYDINPTSK